MYLYLKDLHMTELYNVKIKHPYLHHHHRKTGGLEPHINTAIYEQRYMCTFNENALLPPLRTHKP